MRTKLKICGITNFYDAQMAVGLGVHWLGFNFYEKSPRYIQPGEAARIIANLKHQVETVAVLVRPSRKDIETVLSQCQVDRLQIYEAVDVDDFSVFGLPVIDCYRLNPNEPLVINSNGAEMLLLDSYSEKVLGGSGKTFDWNQIPAEVPRDKLVLAGGITPENIAEALATVRPAVIDVASGVESSPGIKDAHKIKKLISEIHKFNGKRSEK